MKDLSISAKSNETMPDVQGSQDTRQVDIQRVGIKAIRHPIRVLDKSDGVQHTIATFAMYVGLPRHFRGTHMSRFVEILCAQEREISVENFEAMLRSMVQHLDAKTGRIEMQFPFFMNKKAPVTGVMSLMDYDATIIGELENNEFRQTLKIVVPVTSLCPCSKKISDRGAHNQRSHVTVTVVLSAFVWIEEIVTLVEAQGSCELFGLLKRPDEKYVTERAYDHPKFVEDIVRDVVLELRREKRISSFTVEAENFESIHNHSAYALVGETFRG